MDGESSSSMSHDIITLNVGGVEYMTTRTTLTHYPDSMLGAMFNGSMSSTKDKQNNYFIDRDGNIFRYILNFLRSGKLSLPKGFSEYDLFLTEADFYQIKPLFKAILLQKESVFGCEGGEYNYLEIIEVRVGSIPTMPTNNSRIKTILSGRKDVILTLPTQLIGEEGREKLQLQQKNSTEFTEMELNGSNIRLRIGEYLRNFGWELQDSNISSSSGYDVKSLISNLIIEQSYRDRWVLPPAKHCRIMSSNIPAVDHNYVADNISDCNSVISHTSEFM